MSQMTTEEVWGEFSDGLWRFIRARVASDADADDVLQNAFLKIHDRRDQLRDEERLAGWVFRIASNAISDHHRGRERSTPQPEDRVVEPPELGPDPEKLLAQCVRPFVESLSPIYREALTLTELEGMTQADAADHVGISVSGMKSRVQRGRDRLRAAVEQCCEVRLDTRNRVMDAEARCTPADCSVADGR